VTGFHPQVMAPGGAMGVYPKNNLKSQIPQVKRTHFHLLVVAHPVVSRGSIRINKYEPGGDSGVINGTYVYADITFLINLLMDFVILWAAAKLAGLRVVYRRIMMASVLGAVYSVGYLFPHLACWYDLPIKILFSCILIILAFWPSGWTDFKKAFLYFYGVSFVVAGAVMSSSYLFSSKGTFNFSYSWLLGGILCAFCLGKWGERYIVEKVIPGVMRFPVSLIFDGACCQGEGFLDTGNNLRDPLTQRPVIVVEYNLLRNCLPADVRAVLDASGNDDDYLEAMTSTTWANRLRVIPFTSIGKKHGLLPGLRCDDVIVETGDIPLVHRNLVVGIYRDRLSPEGKFQMLLPSEILLKE
jgi:stage II sporulation protein GA (sporulation sigma-E factor processing peptidase)